MLCFSTNGVPYFSAVYKQLDKLVSKPRVKMRSFPTNMKDERETYIYIYLFIHISMKYSHLIDRDDAESKHTIIMTHDYILFHCFVKLDVLCLALCFIQDVDRVFLFFFLKFSIDIENKKSYLSV